MRLLVTGAGGFIGSHIAEHAVAAGHSAHRLLVEWSRIEPTPGCWDEDALDHYRQMVKGLRAQSSERTW